MSKANIKLVWLCSNQSENATSGSRPETNLEGREKASYCSACCVIRHAHLALLFSLPFFLYKCRFFVPAKAFC